MATANELNTWLNQATNNNPFAAFTADERHSMAEEDLFAGKAVSGILVSIVAMGMTLMIATVLFYCLD